jgi:hypothetical protein
VAVTITGIRIDDIQIEPATENGVAGGHQIKQAKYCLIGSTGKVLAEQYLGGYNGRKFEPSEEAKLALAAFMKLYTRDVQALIGMLE